MRAISDLHARLQIFYNYIQSWAQELVKRRAEGWLELIDGDAAVEPESRAEERDVSDSSALAPD